MHKDITESVQLSAAEMKGGRLRIKIIDAGSGSSGDYPDSTLQLAVKEGVFAKGLHMYVDHPTVQEGFDRPERTIKDLAAVLETDAWHVPDEKALYADAKVFPNWREAIKEMASTIGVSIRASAEVSEGDGGRPVIDRIVEAFSVDFVTKAGRGGKITEVLESARAADRAVAVHGVSEATAGERREQLRAAVSTAHPNTEDEGTYQYAWVKDFDESTVWYELESSADGHQLYQQAYTAGEGTAELTGDPTPVRVEIKYVPVAAQEAATPTDSPSIPAGVTENGKGPTVATTNIEESALADLQAKASRVTALEESNRELQAAARQSAATAIVAEAFAGIAAPKTMERLAKGAPVKEDGSLDADALRAEATEAAAEWKLAQGEGTVRGLGDTAPVVEEAATSVGDADILTALKGA